VKHERLVVELHAHQLCTSAELRHRAGGAEAYMLDALGMPAGAALPTKLTSN